MLMSDSTDNSQSRGFPPETVVQYKDPYAEDRAYRAVFSWDEGAGTVDLKLSAVMHDHVPAEMEAIRTEERQVIAYCDADGTHHACLRLFQLTTLVVPAWFGKADSFFGAAFFS
jgi:hypothetical protein